MKTEIQNAQRADGKPVLGAVFSVGEKIKLNNKPAMYLYAAKIGAVGEVMDVAQSIGKICYWVKFKGGEEWWYESQVSAWKK